MRTHYPDQAGFIERDGVKILYEVFGTGEPTVLLLPTWSIVHSRLWKAQVPFLARHCRVITFDGRGNGQSSRPESAEAYDGREFVADALAVIDATETGQAVYVSLSAGANWALPLAAEHPERISRLVFIGPALPLSPPHPWRIQYSFLGAFRPNASTHPWSMCLPMSLKQNTSCVSVEVVWISRGHSNILLSFALSNSSADSLPIKVWSQLRGEARRWDSNPRLDPTRP